MQGTQKLEKDSLSILKNFNKLETFKEFRLDSKEYYGHSKELYVHSKEFNAHSKEFNVHPYLKILHNSRNSKSVQKKLNMNSR